MHLKPFSIHKLLSLVGFGIFILLGTRKAHGVRETCPHCGQCLGPSAKLTLMPSQFHWLSCRLKQSVKLECKNWSLASANLTFELGPKVAKVFFQWLEGWQDFKNQCWKLGIKTHHEVFSLLSSVSILSRGWLYFICNCQNCDADF